ncbi:MAG TPA: methyltransferase domain-containing protein [Mobilitalea sp.]|nr:methyltransferase domain-containing protein [Mobilitalea sp.]
MKNIQLKIEELRKKQGISQKDLADQIGVSFQSISKWENGVNMPDITLLPVISDFFSVTVDELLGLKPLPNREYISSKTDTLEFWRHKSNYLSKNKIMFWNDDYLEFLVKSVWKLDKPVNIIDFGCGTGFLGSKLLPLLPPGSSYTGIDLNLYFIEEARCYFSHTEYKTEFINCDLYSYLPDKTFDIVISQAVLRHLSKPKEVLKKMTESVTTGGLVICIEVNREFENDGLYIDGMDYNYLCTGFDYHQSWKTELEKQGRDYAIGVRIPLYMKEFGLHDIDVRVSDKVLFIDPQKPEYENLLQDFIHINGWDHTPNEEEIEGSIALFMNRGMTRTEAEAYIKRQSAISNHLNRHYTDASLLKFLGLVISWGKK